MRITRPLLAAGDPDDESTKLTSSAITALNRFETVNQSFLSDVPIHDLHP